MEWNMTVESHSRMLINISRESICSSFTLMNLKSDALSAASAAISPFIEAVPCVYEALNLKNFILPYQTLITFTCKVISDFLISFFFAITDKFAVHFSLVLVRFINSFLNDSTLIFRTHFFLVFIYNFIIYRCHLFLAIIA